MSVGGLTTFNTNDGYVEAIVRGFRSGILSQSDYMNLTQCDVLDDIKVALAATDYGHFLQNEPSPLSTTVIAEKCTQKLVDEFNYLRAHCVEPLATFLDFITHGYMIDNVVLLLLGTINNRDLQELLDKCHPLGMFESMESVRIAQNPQELYNTILVDTPLAPYFLGAGKDWAPWSFDFTDISQQQYLVRGDDLGEVNIEIIRNRLYKNYLEQFYAYCQELGGTTAEVMGEILQFEADRRAINITINSFGTELSKDDRRNLFPTFGLLAPEGLTKLAAADDLDAVRNTMEYYAPYRAIFNDVGFNSDKSLEDAFFEHEVQLNKLSFMQQFHYGVFYSYLKLKEQEIRNIVWIAECVAQDRKQSIQQYIPIFQAARLTGSGGGVRSHPACRCWHSRSPAGAALRAGGAMSAAETDGCDRA